MRRSRLRHYPVHATGFGVLDDGVDDVGDVEGVVVRFEVPQAWKAFFADAAPTMRTKKLRIQMRDSQVSTVFVPSESLPDDMERCCVHQWKNLMLLLRIGVAIQILEKHLKARMNSLMMTQRAWSGCCRERVKTP